MKVLVKESQKKVLQNIRPAFKKDGMVTAGNASGINDGAAALIVMSEEKSKRAWRNTYGNMDRRRTRRM